MVSSTPSLTKSKPELLAPAGDWECARAAVANGADAIYFGLPAFNARLRATNFTAEDLPNLMDFLHQHEVKGYVAFNTLIFTSELPDAAEQLAILQVAGVDAAIVQDVGLCVLARELVPDFSIHASTQMTLTSPEGLAFAHRLGISRAVVARELSLRELAKFSQETSAAKGPIVPLEVFVHGALCVAYSGQCLTSEALGQRSANRGECAQACRLPYELVVDGVTKPLGDRRYLLSPQDLAAVEHIPELIRLGITSFKIEGRLKTPEYVAAVTQVYRRAIDAAWEAPEAEPAVSQQDRYQLEMAFSRGLYTGWLGGVNHQELVHARFGKKRGAFLGTVTRIGRDYLEVTSGEAPLALGDGVVIDAGADTDHEQGGRLYEVAGGTPTEEGQATWRLRFEHGKIRFDQVKPGNRIWKTDDPQLNRQLRQSFQNEIEPPKKPLHLRVKGQAGTALTLLGWLGDEQAPLAKAQVISEMLLQTALKRPLTDESLHEQLSRLGDTPFALGSLQNELQGEVILPVKELNRLRRVLADTLAAQLSKISPTHTPKPSAPPAKVLAQLLQQAKQAQDRPDRTPELLILCRTMDQVKAALDAAVATIYVDFEDIRRYREAVQLVRDAGSAQILLATPRIHKAGETGVFRLLEKSEADGILVRNLGALDYFRQVEPRPRLVGDFSLNVANPLTASHLMQEGLDRLTISYDLNAQQVLDLLRNTPSQWLEITLHQNIPMFHMEHCVFAAFLSEGTDHTNCGRPCDVHQLELRDRVGLLHPVKADVGCRNTVFHGQSQSGASVHEAFAAERPAGFRVELLGESKERAAEVIGAYRRLLAGEIDSATLLRLVRARNQLGVTVTG